MLVTVVIFPSFFEVLLNIFIFTYTHDEVGQNIDMVHAVEILKIINKSPIDGRIWIFLEAIRHILDMGNFSENS